MKTASHAKAAKPPRRTLAQQPAFDNAILEAARQFIAAHRYPPTMRELRAITGASSTSVVRNSVFRLERDGRLMTDAGKSRTIVITDEESA